MNRRKKREGNRPDKHESRSQNARGVLRVALSCIKL